MMSSPQRPMIQTGQAKHQLSLIHTFHSEMIPYVSQPCLDTKTDHMFCYCKDFCYLMQEKQSQTKQ